jgi:hypothetical protein
MTKRKRAYTTLFWCGEAANVDHLVDAFKFLAVLKRMSAYGT